MPNPVTNSSTPFKLAVLYLIFEYGRPQAFIPFISIFRPGVILIILLTVILIRDGILTNTTLLKQSPTYQFALLLLLMIVHVPFATNNYWALQILKNVFFFFIIYLTIITYLDSLDRIRSFLFIWMMVNIFCSVNGIFHNGLIPNSAFMGDENDFALAMNMSLPIAFFMLPTIESRSKKMALWLSIPTFTLGSVLSLSRGGFIGLVAVGCYCWLKSSKKLVSAVIVIVMAFLAITMAPATYWDEIKSITQENISKGTGYDRWYMWQLGWDMFMDNLIIGVGQGNYPWNVGKYEAADVSVDWYSHAGRPAHSLYVTLLSELGLVGLILYYSLISSPYKRIRKVIERLKIRNRDKGDRREVDHALFYYYSILFGITGSLVGYLVSGMFLSVLYYPHFYLLIGILSALKNIIEKHEASYASQQAEMQNERARSACK